MPEISLEAENVSNSIFDIDQLRLKHEEKARIVMLDSIRYEVCHYMLDGTMSPQGRPRGTYYACLGDRKKTGKGEPDSDKCPACSVSSDADGAMVGMPKRRFLMNVARYRTNNRGQVRPPVASGMNYEVWLFAEAKFKRLFFLREENGSLKNKDLMLTCTAETFQTMDIDVGNKSFISEEKDAVQVVKEIIESIPDDIERRICRKMNYSEMEKFIGGTDDEMSDDEVQKFIDDVVESVDSDSTDDNTDDDIDSVEELDLDELLNS